MGLLHFLPEGTLWRSKVDGSEQLQLTFPPMRAFPCRAGRPTEDKSPSVPFLLRDLEYLCHSEHRRYCAATLPSDQSQLDVGWSPDGKSLVFGFRRRFQAIDLYPRPRFQAVSTLPDSSGLLLSPLVPGRKYISGTISVGGRLMLFDFSAQKWTKVTVVCRLLPNWSRDGKYLYFQIS